MDPPRLETPKYLDRLDVVLSTGQLTDMLEAIVRPAGRQTAVVKLRMETK